jgi:hypothetical protein
MARGIAFKKDFFSIRNMIIVQNFEFISAEFNMVGMGTSRNCA